MKRSDAEAVAHAALGRIGYSVRRYYVDLFFTAEVSALPEDTLVLDLGGLKIGKRGQFDLNAWPVRPVYLNLVSDRLPDVQADASAVPFATGSFDVVICAELLEHVQDPRLVVREAGRVLRPGGILLATVPFLYRLHADPHDFGRYTPEFWRQTLRNNGFGSVAVRQHGRLWSVLADFATQWASEVGAPRPFGRLAAGAVKALARFAVCRDRRPLRSDRSFSNTFATGFGIIASKGLVNNNELILS